MDKKAFFKLSYGLYVVSSNFNSKDSACIANTFIQVTSNPAQVCITLNKNNYTTELIQDSCIYNVGVLLDSVEMDVIRRFGFHSGRDIDKFADIEYFVDSQNVKQITKGIAASFSVKVISMLDVGSHIMFVGDVVDCKVIDDGEVLTYANYHNIKKGSTPKNASSYQGDISKHGWRCSVCGFVLEQDKLPDDYICPVCKQPASVFEKI
ncbi:flavin reductase [Thomasclavelia sp.]